MFKKVCAGLATLAAIAVVTYVRCLRPWYLRWGATQEEVEHPLSGDALIAHPKMESTRAITIQAQPTDIWPWLMQIGLGRGGLYSYAWLENLLPSSAIGTGITNAEQIIPAFQHLEVGDSIPISPTTGLTVAELVPDQVLVLHLTMSPLTGMPVHLNDPKLGAYLDWRWTFSLHKRDEQATRLIVRVRADYQPQWLIGPLLALLVEPAHFLMERKMLLGIKQRAEHAS